MKKEMKVKKGTDLVVQGLAFITFNKDITLTIYTKKGVNIYTRKKFI